MKNEIYKALDKSLETILDFLNNYAKSKFLQNYFFNLYKSFFYANLINNFFLNLKKDVIKEYRLPQGKIGKLNRRFKTVKKEIKKAISLDLKDKFINESYYKSFKGNIRKEHPFFIIIFDKIEKQININKAREFLKKKKRELLNTGKHDCDLHTSLLTKTVELFIHLKKPFPKEKEFMKLIHTIGRRVLPNISKEVTKSLQKSKNKMLNNNRRYQEEFENRLYYRWKEPIDLLESLIQVSYESGEKLGSKLSKTTDNTNKFKREALFKIHARALQISKEILVLLKSGYADGAISRWRTLYELSVIAHLLTDNSNDVSKRYLEHQVIRDYKEAKDYQSYYKKLGYLPINRKAFNRIKKTREVLINNYGKDFKDDYGWIPKSILGNRVFRELEKYVKLDKFRPYYNLSCDASHGGSKGFYRLGLSDKYQRKIYLAGPSNYGLAWPLQNTAISLLQISCCLLVLEPDFENIISMNIAKYFVDDIRLETYKAHIKLEKDEAASSK